MAYNLQYVHNIFILHFDSFYRWTFFFHEDLKHIENILIFTAAFLLCASMVFTAILDPIFLACLSVQLWHILAESKELRLMCAYLTYLKMWSPVNKHSCMMQKCKCKHQRVNSLRKPHFLGLQDYCCSSTLDAWDSSHLSLTWSEQQLPGNNVRRNREGNWKLRSEWAGSGKRV